METILTSGRGGRILTNCAVWSTDSQWIVFDERSDAVGSNFDGAAIRMVHVKTKEIRTLFEAKNGAHCGVVTWHPKELKVAFILGPEHPTKDWSYGPSRRQGVIVEVDKPGRAIPIDARDLTAPFTPGALRGGSHVHVLHPRGDWLSFTYDDEVLRGSPRNIAVSVPAGAVKTSRGHERNHDGTYFTVLGTRTTASPKPGSDEIQRACEEAWVGDTRMLAFQGEVITKTGKAISEVFVLEMPEDVREVGDGPLQGTLTQLPSPPKGTQQHRRTFTSDRKYPGLQGPRHWLRSSPDGAKIGFLMKDDAGIVQFWTISPQGGTIQQITRDSQGVGSAFTWSPCGQWVAAVVGDCVSRIEIATGRVTSLSPPSVENNRILPLACVISPDGKMIAYIRRGESNQIAVTSG